MESEHLQMTLTLIGKPPFLLGARPFLREPRSCCSPVPENQVRFRRDETRVLLNGCMRRSSAVNKVLCFHRS